MTDPVLLITGASSGIGAATARLAAETGYRIALAARSEHKLTELVDELGGPDRALAVRCDVKEYAEQKAMVKRVLDHFGQLDAVYANAGMPGSEGGFSGADPEVWRDMLLTNVYGVGLTLRCSLGALKASRGHVLLTGSAAGRFVIPGSMYSASKWAVTGMGLSVREELRGTGVRVTLIDFKEFFEYTPGVRADFRTCAAPALRQACAETALSQPGHVDVNEILIRPVPPIADD